MAEYLLKGGKMLAKTCPDCGSPLFEYKGNTFCVVCNEAETEEQTKDQGEKSSEKPYTTPQSVKVNTRGIPHTSLNLDEQFASTIKTLLIRIEEETDSRRLTKLTHAIKDVSQAYAMISQEYDNLDSS